MDIIYKTNTTSKRHRELGYCEESDFGKIELIELKEDEIKFAFLLNGSKGYVKGEKITTHKSNRPDYVYSYKNIYLTSYINLPFGREEDEKYLSKQGKFTHNTSKQLMVKVRLQQDDNFYPAFSKKYYLIGKKLYQKWCKKSDLKITISSNMVFSSWIDMDIEPRHVNKNNIKFNKENFYKTLKELKLRYEKNASETRIGQLGQNYFSYPNITKWGVIL